MQIRFMIAGAALSWMAASAQTTQVKTDFAKDVAPVLEQQCLACHSQQKRAGGLAIVSREALIARNAIIPGKPDASPLYVLSALPSGKPGAMPPGGPRMPDDQLAALRNWIAAGAPWPKGASLTTVKSIAPSADEHETVRRIRERIVERQKAAGGAMQPYRVTIPNSTVTYEMVPIPAGKFAMGASASDKQHMPDELPQHAVTLSPFWMQAHEVTWDEYRLFMFATGPGRVPTNDGVVDAIAGPTRPYVEMSFGMGINGFPAISMTQHAANKYAEWLSAKTGEFYRLPTEAEWEYACRAGTATPYFFGDASAAGDYAWYLGNSNGKYQKVGTKKPNPWGLYDIAGNVAEWTLDQYEPYRADSETNPWVQAKTPYPQVARGGSWNDPEASLRCSARLASDESWKQQDPQLPKSIWYLTDAQWLGFRLVRPAVVPPAAEMFKYWNNGVEHDEQ